jgi:hypothetical protein
MDNLLKYVLPNRHGVIYSNSIAIIIYKYPVEIGLAYWFQISAVEHNFTELVYMKIF